MMTFYNESVWERFAEPGEVKEMRIPNATGTVDGRRVYGGTVSGYFDNQADFCSSMREASRLQNDGIYFTLQVIDPRLIGRAFNRLKVTKTTTSDNNVLAYRWLPLDFDPVRPAGISSSDLELAEAIALRDKVVPIIQDRYGFPDPVLAMSGNGGHALFRLPDLPADAENEKMLKGLLNSIHCEFGTATKFSGVSIDITVYNPARIWKLYGSTARKGDSVPAGEYRDARPHRESYIESLGG